MYVQKTEQDISEKNEVRNYDFSAYFFSILCIILFLIYKFYINW